MKVEKGRVRTEEVIKRELEGRNIERGGDRGEEREEEI